MIRIARVLFLLAGLVAAGPNRAAVQAPPLTGAEAGCRLDVTRMPLSDLCWVMTKRSGIRHDVADTETGDLLVSAVGEVSIQQLREALGGALGVVWKQVGAGGALRY